jgi:enterochelin esterase-like enzyme
VSVIHWLLYVTACAAPPSNPVIDGSRATLFIEAPAGVTPSVTGDFTHWKPQSALPQRFRPGWFTFETTLEPDARVEYLLSFGHDKFQIDPRNPLTVASVAGEASEIAMPNAEAHPELSGNLQAPLVSSTHDFTLPNGNVRRVTVYKPEHESTGASLPVIYFNDGALMIAGQVPTILARLVATKRLKPLIAVFVDPASRAEDYSASQEFREWFARNVIAFAENGSRPPMRAVIGVSRSAIAALDLVWHYPDLFDRCGLLIPSTYPTALTQLIADSAAKPVQFSIVAGRYDTRWLEDGRALATVLRKRGYQLTYREVPEGHNPQTWRGHLDDVLVALGF